MLKRFLMVQPFFICFFSIYFCTSYIAPLFVPKAQIPSLTSSLKDENSPPDSPVDSKTKMYPPADSSAHPNHSRSLPTSRRNSGDYTNLWNAMDSLSFNPRFSADARKTEPEDETKPNTPFEGKSAANFASDTSLNDLQNCSSRGVLANTIADSNKKDSVIKEVDKSPSAPPQFSDSFMLEDDGASTAGVVSTGIKLFPSFFTINNYSLEQPIQSNIFANA